MATNETAPENGIGASWTRERVYDGIDWHHDDGRVVQLREVEHVVGREMTRRTTGNGTDTGYRIYVRPAPGEPADEYEELSPTYDKGAAIARAREYVEQA